MMQRKQLKKSGKAKLHNQNESDIKKLPNKLWSRAFGFFKSDDLQSIRATCTQFHDLTSLKIIDQQYQCENGIDVSADGKLIATTDGGVIRIFELSTGKLITSFRENQTRWNATPVIFTKDNKYVLHGKDHNGEILMTNIQELQWKDRIEVKNFGKIAPANMGSVQILTMTNGNFILYYPEFFKCPNLFLYNQNGEQISQFNQKLNYKTLTISSDENYIICPYEKKEDHFQNKYNLGIDFFIIQDNKIISDMFIETNFVVQEAKLSHNNKKIVCRSHDELQVIDVKTNAIEFGYTYNIRGLGLQSIAISSDDKYIAAALPWGINIYDLQTGKEIKSILTESTANEAFFTPDDQLVIGCGSRILTAHLSSVLELQEEFDEQRYLRRTLR